MKLKLMTAEKTLFEGEVASVSGRAPKGDFEILEGHGAWVSPLDIDVLTVGLGDGESNIFAVHGGLVEVGPESVLVLADTAEAAGDVDSDRARRALDRAKERLAPARSGDEEFDSARALYAIARAKARLEVSGGQA